MSDDPVEVANDEVAPLHLSLPLALKTIEDLFDKGTVTLLDIKIALAEVAT